MKISKVLIKLESQIERDFGNRCKKYDAICAVCRVYEAFDILNQLFGVQDNIGRVRKFEEYEKN